MGEMLPPEIGVPLAPGLHPEALSMYASIVPLPELG